MQTLALFDEDQVELPDAEQFMRPERLAALVPTRLSASRSLVNLMAREMWRITSVEFDIDDRARGEAIYRIDTPSQSFSFVVFSFEPKLKGRTGRIIGTDWDMMGALVEGIATERDIRQTRVELPKLYAGRASPKTLVWCRSNRSLRLFEHVIDALASQRQPSVAALWRVGYLMRNTGLDGNGTFGTRSYLSLEDDHPLRAPYHAQMLAAYMMREFSFDLTEHLARCRNPDAVSLDGKLKRVLGIGNGSALGLVFFTNNHPQLVHRWLTIRCHAAMECASIPMDAGSDQHKRFLDLLRRAIRYYEDDPCKYESFTPARSIALDLKRLLAEIELLETRARAEDSRLSYLGFLERQSRQVSNDALEVCFCILMELRPEFVDSLMKYLPATEDLTRSPTDDIASLLDVITREYRWVEQFDMTVPSERRYRWYKSIDAEEPRRGPLEEIPGGFEWALDLPGDIQRLRDKLEKDDPSRLVGEFLFDHPEERWTVERIQGQRGALYHSPHMNMLAEGFIPAHIIRLVNSAFHGLDKTTDTRGRNVLGLIFHGAPIRKDLETGAHGDWLYPAMPEGD